MSRWRPAPVDWCCTHVSGCDISAVWSDGESEGACRLHAADMGVDIADKTHPIEVRVIPDGDSWTVEGWRGGEQRYTRLFNRTADEAWHYGAEWMRGEMLKKAKETK